MSDAEDYATFARKKLREQDTELLRLRSELRATRDAVYRIQDLVNTGQEFSAMRRASDLIARLNRILKEG